MGFRFLHLFLIPLSFALILPGYFLLLSFSHIFSRFESIQKKKRCDSAFNQYDQSNPHSLSNFPSCCHSSIGLGERCNKNEIRKTVIASFTLPLPVPLPLPFFFIATDLFNLVPSLLLVLLSLWVLSRPYILVGSIFLSLAYTLLWIPPQSLPEIVLSIWFGGFYLLSVVGVMIFITPYL